MSLRDEVNASTVARSSICMACSQYSNSCCRFLMAHFPVELCLHVLLSLWSQLHFRKGELDGELAQTCSMESLLEWKGSLCTRHSLPPPPPSLAEAHAVAALLFASEVLSSSPLPLSLASRIACSLVARASIAQQDDYVTSSVIGPSDSCIIYSQQTLIIITKTVTLWDA